MPNRYGWMSDTSPEAFAKLLELQGAMTPGERLVQSLRLTRLMMRMVEAGVRRDFPEASEREVFLRAAVRRLGPELVKKAYGWEAPEGDP